MRPYCLATVTDDRFCIGTEVLLYSFLKYNPWFDGDVVVLVETLSGAAQERLRALHPVRFVTRDPRLAACSRTLQDRIPALRDIHLRFLSLEAFRLVEYKKVVFVDSDVACMGDVSELFVRAEPLLAGYDGYSYEERLSPILERAGRPPIGTPVRYGQRFEQSLSSGVMAVAGEHLSRDTYLGLLEVMAGYEPEGELVFTDQMVLNRYFQGRFTPISGKYNYRALLESYIRFLDGISFPDARLLHFSGAIKPWNRYRMTELASYAPQYIKFLDVWRELLDEARHRGDPDHQARQIVDQLQLLELDTARATPSVLGRLV